MSDVIRLKNIVAAHAATTKAAAALRAEVVKSKPSAKVIAALDEFNSAVKAFDKVIKAPNPVELDPVAPVHPADKPEK